MRHLHITTLPCLTVVLSLTLVGCGTDLAAPGESAEVSAAALTGDLPANATDIILGDSVIVGGCQYTIGTATLKGPPFPPPYVAFVRRTAVSVACGDRAGYQLFGENVYDRPTVAIARGAEGQLAVAATQKPNISGSSPSHIDLARLRVLTLKTVAGAMLAAPRIGSNPPNANIDLRSIVFTVPGDLIVVGTKLGAIPGELGRVGGPDFQASYAGFASATTLGLSPTQVLAW